MFCREIEIYIKENIKVLLIGTCFAKIYWGLIKR